MEKHLILASQSPRRREMVSWLNLSVTTAKADIDETPGSDEKPRQFAGRLAAEKAGEIRKKYENSYILSADTVVDLDQHILGKPESPAHAATILKQLRNAQHQVHTAVSLMLPDNDQILTVIVTTDVWMRPYSNPEIDAYIASNDPLDKAGAYAIQHRGFHPVQRLNRCYANVVGFPICAIKQLLTPYFLVNGVDPFSLCRQHFDYRCPGQDKGTYL